MAKLKGLMPRIGALPPRVGLAPRTEQERDRFRVENDPSRKWYRTARWKKARMAVFMRDGFTCRMCGHIEPDLSKLVCDHVEPHKGSEERFWSMTNLQTLCASPCHNSHKQRLDKQAARGPI